MKNGRRNDQSDSPDATRAWIRLELAKRGLNLLLLAAEKDYSYHQLRAAMVRRKPKAERIIAAAIGTSPRKIWPERYVSVSRRRATKGLGR